MESKQLLKDDLSPLANIAHRAGAHQTIEKG